MSLNVRSFRSLAALAELVPEIVYVMCGARGEVRNRLTAALPRARFLGFEPDEKAHQRLARNPQPGYTYYKIAVGGREEARTLYLTREPACSSLLKPNACFFGQFTDCAEQIEVVEQQTVETVSLNNFLPKEGISNVDFLELDTQGTELEILKGADYFLVASVVGLKIEVEFSPMYEGQPLFGAVDEYLRGFGFMLFDLSRNRYRRAAMPHDLVTRGQLLWGDAVYLRDYDWFTGSAAKERLLKLCVIAGLLGFHDYALEAWDFVLREGVGAVSDLERAALTNVRKQYLDELYSHSTWLRCFSKLGKLGIRLSRRARTAAFSWVD
ncbi:MAG: FkbM family methyltransferase [Terriglobales bacterium]